MSLGETKKPLLALNSSAAPYANVFQNANTDLWNIDFPYHTHIGLSYVNFLFPFCHIKLPPLEMIS